MRTAYAIVNKLMWDASFRDEFCIDRRGAILSHFPDAENELHLFGDVAKLYGLREEAYRRSAALQRTSAAIFSHSHQLLLALFGVAFFDALLAAFFRKLSKEGSPSMRILEPFDGYVVGPQIISQAGQLISRDDAWVLEVMAYDWAIWHARRVVQGWPSLTQTPPLVPGGALLAFDFDIKSLLREIKRLDACGVAPELYRERIVPGSGTEYLAIYPSGAAIAVATMDKDNFEILSKALADQTSLPRADSCAMFESIGLVVNASFLCCSREAADEERLNGELPQIVEPQPH